MELCAVQKRYETQATACERHACAIQKFQFTNSGAARPAHHRIYLNREIYLDIQWWCENLLQFNGKARIPAVAHECDIRLDATGDGGLGVFIDGAFIALSSDKSRQFWAASDHPVTSDANHWELFNFVVLVRTYADYLRDKVVVVDNDNTAAIFGVRKFSCGSTDAVETARILRILFAECVRLNLRLQTRWVPGEQNVLPDALSRCDEPGKWAVAARELERYRAGCGCVGVSPYLQAMRSWSV